LSQTEGSSFGGEIGRMARVARKTGVELALHIARLAWCHPATARLRGGIVAACGAALATTLITYNPDDRSWNVASAHEPTNALGATGAILADIGLQSLGVAAGLAALLILVNGLSRVIEPEPDMTRGRLLACWLWRAHWPWHRPQPSGLWRRAWAGSGVTRSWAGWRD